MERAMRCVRCARSPAITRFPKTPASAIARCIGALQGYEADLHQHIHLENNILFPRAIAMEAKR